jgi:hypothetical protein
MAITNFCAIVGLEGERENFKLETDQNRPDLAIAIHDAAKIFRLERWGAGCSKHLHQLANGPHLSDSLMMPLDQINGTPMLDTFINRCENKRFRQLAFNLGTGHGVALYKFVLFFGRFTFMK